MNSTILNVLDPYLRFKCLGSIIKYNDGEIDGDVNCKILGSWGECSALSIIDNKKLK